jgi:hypothetical protein
VAKAWCLKRKKSACNRVHTNGSGQLLKGVKLAGSGKFYEKTGLFGRRGHIIQTHI